MVMKNKPITNTGNSVLEIQCGKKHYKNKCLNNWSESPEIWTVTNLFFEHRLYIDTDLKLVFYFQVSLRSDPQRSSCLYSKQGLQYNSLLKKKIRKKIDKRYSLLSTPCHADSEGCSLTCKWLSIKAKSAPTICQVPLWIKADVINGKVRDASSHDLYKSSLLTYANAP